MVSLPDGQNPGNMQSPIRGNPLCAALVRLFKYLIPAYFQEFASGLRQFIITSTTEESLVLLDPQPEDRRPDLGMRQLYGDFVFPTILTDVLNVNVFDPKKGDELQIDFLSVAARTRLVQSKCYAAFAQGVFEQKLGDVKSEVEAPDAERKAKVDALLASREDHAELLFAATVLEQKLGQYDMVKYLFSSQNHFPWLQARSAEVFPLCCAEIDCR